MQVTGFILQASYRVVQGKPVIHVYGRTQDGRTFLILDDRLVPAFYIRQTDAQSLEFANHRVCDTDWTTLDGYPAARIETRLPRDVPPLRDQLHELEVCTYQADVRFAVEYLIRNNVRGGCSIHGHAQEGVDGIDLVFANPELTATVVDFEPSCIAFDIETDMEAHTLLAISLYGNDVDEVVIHDPVGRRLPDNAIGFGDERSVLKYFANRIRELNPDVLTGWNVIDFDLNVLNRVAKRVRFQLELGRGPGTTQIRKAQGYFGSGQANMPGRVVLDGIDLVRGAFIRFEEYSLEFVARSVLGEGKALHGEVSDRGEEIQDSYKTDLASFAHYARTDSRLAYEIVRVLKLLPLAVERSKLTGMTMDRVSASIASFDFVYLSALSRRRICAPSVGSSDSRVSERHAGGHVMEPHVGIHENVWIFDFKSLYPSIMRTFNIDPLTHVQHSKDENECIELLNGAVFSRETAILPAVLDSLFEARENAKKTGDGIASQAIKILMNSFYGVLATPACRFYDGKLGNSITTMGRHFLLWSRDWFETKGHRVLYGDTDSVFVSSNLVSPEEANVSGNSIISEFNEALERYVVNEWSVENKLVLEFEKMYSRLFLLPLKKGTGGARKRYAGIVYGENDVEFTGMEVVRRDWTELAKDVQRELYKRMFDDEPVEEYLLDCAQALRAGKLDGKLIYRKGLSKDPSEYTKSQPPHVVAARKSKSTSRVVHYVITTAGPEPIDALKHPPDRAHYLNTQVRAVAEPVLETLGLDFDFVVRNTHQEPLF